MASADVTRLDPPRPLPEYIAVSLTGLRFSVREMRLIREALGRGVLEIFDENYDGPDEDKLLVLAFLRLRREGYENATMDDAETVLLDVQEPAPPDPTNAGPSTTSPPSVASGE